MVGCRLFFSFSPHHFKSDPIPSDKCTRNVAQTGPVYMLKAGNKQLYPSATHCYQKYLMIFTIYFVDFFSPSAFSSSFFQEAEEYDEGKKLTKSLATLLNMSA